jgi:translocation and assembly module TamB
MLGGGCWWLLNYIDERLAPQISESLSESLDRPVELGDVEAYSLTSLRFGPSRIPTYQRQVQGQSVTDADQATVAAVQVEFDLLQTLLKRTLNLNITLEQPELYLDQNQQGVWLETLLPEDEEEEEGLIKLQVAQLSIEAGEAVVQPYEAPARTITNLTGAIALSNDNQHMDFKGQGTLDSGGEVQLSGQWVEPEESLTVDVKAKAVAMAPLTNFLPAAVPLQLRAGNLITGQFQLQSQRQQPLKLSGRADISQVSLRLPQQDLWVKAQRIKAQLQGTYGDQETLKLNASVDAVVANLQLPQQDAQMSADRLQTNLRLTLRPQKPLNLAGTLEAKQADVQLPQRNLRVKTGRLQSDLRVTTVNQALPIIGGTAQFKDADLFIPEQLILQNGRSRQQRLTKAKGALTFLPKIQGVQFKAQGQLAAGGTLRSQGVTSLDLTQTNALLLVQNVPASLLDRAYQLPIRVRSGQVNARLALKLRPQQQPDVQGTAQIQGIDAQIVGLPQPFLNANGLVRLRSGLTASLEGVTAQYGPVPLQAEGTISPTQGYDLTAQTPLVTIETALQTLGVPPLPVPVVGKVRLPQLRVTGAIERPLISGIVTAASGTRIDRVPFKELTAQFQLDVPQLQVTAIQARPTAGGVITGRASYDLTPGLELVATLNVRDLPGDRLARLYDTDPGLRLGAISAQVQVTGPPDDLQAQLAFQAPTATYPTRGRAQLRPGLITFNDVVTNVAEGVVRAEGRLTPETVEATVMLAGVQLREFTSDLSGALAGEVRLTAPLATLSPETLRAEGQVQLSQGLPYIGQPFAAQFRWNGRQVVVPAATAPGFQASGTIAASFLTPSQPQITALDLNLQLQDYDLATLSTLNPTAIFLRGRADLTGRLTGTPAAPNLDAALELRQFAVNQLAFASPLSGRLDVDPRQGVDLRLAGDQDRIEVALNPKYQPRSFLIQRDEAIARGRTQGDLLIAEVQQFPLLALNLRPATALGLGSVSGLASGDFVANLPEQSLRGNVALDQPAIGRVRGDRFTGQIRYEGGIASLRDGQLTQRNSQYQINVRLKPGESPDVAGQVQITKGEVADVVALLQALDLGGSKPAVPLGTAADVQTEPIDLRTAPLTAQLDKLNQIQILMAQQQAQLQAQKQAQPFDLANLSGQYQGAIKFASSAQGIEADFELQGQNLGLSDRRVAQVTVNGALQNNTLSFAPLRFASGDRLAAFSGSIGLENLSGQLVLRNVSVEDVTQWVDLPVTVAGDLNGTATLAGDLANPQIQGELSLAEGQLNGTPVDAISADFNYGRSRLNFTSTARIRGPEPVAIRGSIPFALPLAADPDSNALTLDATVQNEGLALLNLLTDQVAWVEGQGQVTLRVRGTMAEPVIDGNVILSGATLKAQALSTPLTNVTGRLNVDENLVVIPSLSGDVAPGQIIATGTLPMFKPNPTLEQPLTVNLNNLDLQVQELYQGGVAGELVITGTAFAPKIGGSIQLRDGKIWLANASSNGKAAAPPQQTTVQPGSLAESPPLGSTSGNSEVAPLKFNQLKVSLIEDVHVTQPPVLSFLAAGELTINGDLNQPVPAGVIQFRKGSVNLLTSRFRIDPRRQNFAEFDPAFGLDPYLDIAMVTTVTEVIQGRTTSLNEFEEVPAGALGTVQSVRVRATVEGRASSLATNFGEVVTLMSDPDRSQGEILALLGGGVTQALQEGQAQQAAVNLASSAAFSSLQSSLDDLLGNRVSFRAFPVLLPDDEARRGNSVLAFGAELGYDVTDRFSVSALQILTDLDEPTLVNLTYDLTDALKARAAISTNGEAVGVLEFRLRF